MHPILQAIIGLAVLVFVVWMLTSGGSSKSGPKVAGDSQLIDPNNMSHVGTLAGLMGGTIPDAAVMRFALKRFEETHGRPATIRDVGIVVGMITGGS